MWHRKPLTTARKGEPAPGWEEGPAGHPCAKCNATSRYEYSPDALRACSLPHLLMQNLPGHTLADVKERHGHATVESILAAVQGTPDGVAA